jgi:hypothetical protein
MEGNVRPVGLRLVPGDGDDSGMADEDRERREAKRVTEALRTAVRNLPSASSLRLPFERLRRALREFLERRG